ncbi:MAG: hypothetical protein ACFFD4_26535 [Candidatus Odinarchaeota archaeon]
MSCKLPSRKESALDRLRELLILFNYNDRNRRGSTIETREPLPITPGPVDLEIMLWFNMLWTRMLVNAK